MKKSKKDTKVKDGIYRNAEGEEIITFKEDVDWITRVSLEPLRDFLDMIGDNDEDQKAMFIAKALLERAEEKICEASEYINENYGRVELVRASYPGTAKIEPETILDIVFTPCKEVTA